MAKITVGIDCGHGSETSGKRTPDQYREHWINTKTCYYLDAALKRNGFATYKSAWNDTNAKDDVDVPLTTRQKNIKAAKCDISVSCHANAYGSDWNSAEGVDTFYHEVAAWRGDSVNLAKRVQKRLIEGTKQKDRGYKAQYLAMCDCKSMGTKASILVEIGFMTNKHEAELMKGEAFCKEQAEEICHGICDYYGKAYKGPSTTTVTTTTTPAKAPTTTTTTTTTTTSASTKVNVYYKTYVGSEWLPEVKNYSSGDDGYAGIYGKAITRLMAKASTGDVEYRVHRVGDEEYLPWVTNYEDYAGWKGKSIDGLQMRYNKNGKKIKYRVHTKAGSWLDWVTEYGSGDNGYAGIYGQAIDGIQIQIV